MFSFLTNCFAARADILLAERHMAGLSKIAAAQPTSVPAPIERIAAEQVEPERIALAA